jgi:demethylmenaquinone methyltransferase/2-methoxy-6-polyprenyl-1,4-benzoquinol methylase
MLKRMTARCGAAVTVVRCAGDIMSIPVRSGSVDVVTMGYGLRNTPDFARGLREIARVLRPGGVLLNLDLCRPSTALWRRLFLGYLGVAGSIAGWIWHGEPVAYAYLKPSIEHFLTAGELSSLLAEEGFVVERLYLRLFGGIAVHVARSRPRA